MIVDRKYLIESLKELLSDEWNAEDFVDATQDEIIVAIINAGKYYQNYNND
jgi:hypothetical protein